MSKRVDGKDGKIKSFINILKNASCSAIIDLFQRKDTKKRGFFIMKAVITVVGHDSKGIIAKVSAGCAQAGANIVEISQSVLKEYFAMIMLIDISDLNLPFTEFVDSMRAMGEANQLDIRTMHEDIFNSMHKI